MSNPVVALAMSEQSLVELMSKPGLVRTEIQKIVRQEIRAFMQQVALEVVNNAWQAEAVTLRPKGDDESCPS